jgi:prolyl oligopeptidase
MKKIWALFCCLLACASGKNAAHPQPGPRPAATSSKSAAEAEQPLSNTDDPNLWLEEVTGERALAWVAEQNTKSVRQLTTDAELALKTRLLSIYDSKAQIPFTTTRGQFLYNFWQDGAHPRGLWRRTRLTDYKKPEPHWETVLDLDELAKAEQENWVYKGVECLRPAFERCLLKLSRGGADAVVVREFNARSKAFVKHGFSLEEAKSEVSWKDENTLFVSTDFGAGSLTDSGYPRIAKEWRRGTPLSAAKTLLEGQSSDVVVTAQRAFHGSTQVDSVQRSLSFFENETFLLTDGELHKLEKPNDAEVRFFGKFVLLELRSDWATRDRTWPAGALLAAPLDDLRRGTAHFEILYEPADNRSLLHFSSTKSALLLNVLEDVRSKLMIARFEDGKWQVEVERTPELASFDAFPFDDDASDRYWLLSEDFTVPKRLELGSIGRPERELYRSMPAYFEAEGLETKQFFATSKDGTKIPYYQVAQKSTELSGKNAVLLTGYGGFEISLTAHYDPTVGAAWLERGGIFVQANIRGGGEYGPKWHQAALKTDRQRAYDDFSRVAEDLIARKLTTPSKLGIMGRSNGGLLMGVMLTERPELFGAIVCSVPLLDMLRYHKLLAGASWMAEYGNPDQPRERAALLRYSPYQNLKPGVKYPRVLFTASTRDDRVHPGHARKMAFRMLQQGDDLLYYENTEGGHAGAANNEERASVNALEYAYLYQQLVPS